MSYTHEPAPAQRWESLIRTAVEGEIVAHEQDVLAESVDLDHFITRAATEAERHSMRLLSAQSRFGAFHAETEASLNRKARTDETVHTKAKEGEAAPRMPQPGVPEHGAAEHGARLDIRF